MKYFVEVINKKTGEVEKSIECKSEREADRVDTGLSINLDHKEFRIEIRTENEP